MTQQEKGITVLLRNALSAAPVSLPVGFDPERAVPQLIRHQVGGLAWCGAVKSGIPQTDPAMKKLLKIYGQNLLRHQRQSAALTALFALFEANGVDYLPLKGCLLKSLYPQPELRVMGDADVLIREEQYPLIEELMCRAGYRQVAGAENTRNWQSDALYLELHLGLMPRDSHGADLNAAFADPWSKAIWQEGRRYAFSPEDEYLFLLLHFVKHYRQSGIGCRHLTDLWVFRRAHPDMDESYLASRLNEGGLGVFHTHLLHTLSQWFDGGEGDAATERITHRIFEGGSWGTTETYALAQEVKRGNKGRFTAAVTMLFPPFGVLKKTYPVLERIPVLFPLFWPYRWVDSFLNRRHNIRNRMQDLRTISPERVSAYQAELAAVGLNFSMNKGDQ